MKITEKLKDRLNGAKSAEEVETIMKEVKKDTEEAGVILSDEELEQASGGEGSFSAYDHNTRPR